MLKSDYLVLAAKASFALFIIGAISTILYFYTNYGFLTVISAVCFSISAVPSFLALVTVLREIYLAKNETSWKVKWLFVVIFVLVVGILIYIYVGRKELKKQV
ncbi:MAG: PLDc N-terminal domain-containing protein [Candidatus Micrarchaeota archaeon]|nr:PLDc N-terminal domain-containing protein [Candidatus Micrarchaeota archaeon]